MTKTATMFPAFMWDCDECGTENFARSFVPELTESEREEFMHESGIDPDSEGIVLAMPERVTCSRCEITFETKSFNED